MLAEANPRQVLYFVAVTPMTFPHPMLPNDDVTVFEIAAPVHAVVDWKPVADQIARFSISVKYESIYEESFALAETIGKAPMTLPPQR